MSGRGVKCIRKVCQFYERCECHVGGEEGCGEV